MKTKETEPFQAHPKPGPPEKKRNTQKEIGRKLEPPEKKHCRVCGQESETCCYRHSEVPYHKQIWGKGTGQRVNDVLMIWACYECDLSMSVQPVKSAPQIVHDTFEIMWSRAIFATLID